ncbi:alpha/beta-hydrolase [Desarmillaria tabescens]|uniref:Carboxylic ester hydrolase n=1 Tax=Armillaria tabescens TaxID=1929756 RepID=A0AA39MS44_ARMTA|nr:alpha/beta-hydrolase [Desarmillaria tabescens]KAK0444572.1 alpha/beta-hydrolase [Desarmillaria tabescens]
MSLLFCLVLMTSGLALEHFSLNLGPVVDLGYMAFAGNDTSPNGIQPGPVVFFGGIPYAQPPVDALRWRAPRSIDEHIITNEIMDARNWGPPCLQVPAMVGIGSEDCLTLNVWKPRNASKGDALPVAVYIHSPQGFPLYDWVEQHDSGLVGVSIAYRLGILGFLGGHLVAADGDLNVGLLDQRAALEWIQRHIHNFGGDPDNVTIYGESAGGASVMMQITAYGGTRPVPFKRAVAQSIAFGPTRTDVEVEETFSNVAQLVGCPSRGTDALRCLRKASLGAIVSASNRLPATEPSQFAPVVEGSTGFMPGLPTRLIASGRFSPVEYIGGHCTGDGRTFTLGQPSDYQNDEDIKELILYWWPALSNSTLHKVLRLYPSPDVPGSPFPTDWDRASTIARDIDFWCLNWFLAEKLIDSGIDNFRWDAPDTVLYEAQPYLGAMHTSDVYYLFSGTSTFGNAGNTFTPFNTSEATLAKEAIAYWTTFASSGGPSSFKASTFASSWEKYVTPNNTRQRMVFIRGNDTMTASQMKPN